MTDTKLNGPPLPAEYAGKAIVWTPWQDRPACGRTVVQRPCKGCGATVPWWTANGAAGGVQRVYARYCPGCKELWVHWKVPPAPGEYVGRLDLIVHSTRQERLDAMLERAGERLRQAVQAELRRMAHRSAAWPFTPSRHGE
jgi:hypothetical protein